MFTPAQLLAMTDNEIGTHASGGYGAKLRNEFYASLRAGLQKVDAKEQILRRAGIHNIFDGKRVESHNG